MATPEVTPLHEPTEPVAAAIAADSPLPLLTSPRPRRKVRKGTKSCWECRHRKIKCIFKLPTDETCIRCARRGAQCVGQEHPEVMTTSLDRSLQMGDRVVRMETVINQLLKEIPTSPKIRRLASPSSNDSKDDDQTENHAFSPLTSLAFKHSGREPLSSTLAGVHSPGFQVLSQDPDASLSQGPRVSLVQTSEHARLSQALRQYLPLEQDVQLITKASSNTSSMFYQMQIVPCNALDAMRSINSMFERPGVEAHPVLIARHMLYLATSLQHLHPEFHREIRGLSRAPHEMRHSLVEIASEMVTAKEELVNSIEGLDCVIIESWYHANNGNLQKALITVRRAITIAQVMGFHRKGNARCTVISPETRAYPDLIWFRIVAHERYLCLMLGVPQSTLDQSMASEAMLSGDTPMGRLDRIHCVIACQLLERNQTDPKEDDYALTRGLDARLQIASKDMPAGWWLTPNLAAGAHQPAALFWYMRQLFHQLHHHSLLVHLHLPYMLRSSQGNQLYEYSRVTCINSSREILSRLIMFHSFNRIAFSCRTIDFFGLMAAIALLLAHMELNQCKLGTNQRPNVSIGITEGLLTHQRSCDRALVEQAQMIMVNASQPIADATNLSCTDQLRRLLAMEEETYDLSMRLDRPGGNPGLSPSNSDATIHLTIPFLGPINVTSKAIIQRDISGTCSTARDRVTDSYATEPFDAYSIVDGQAPVQPPLNHTLDIDFIEASGMPSYSTQHLYENAHLQDYGTLVSGLRSNFSHTAPNFDLSSHEEALGAPTSPYLSHHSADEASNLTLPSSAGAFLNTLVETGSNGNSTSDGSLEWIDALQLPQ